MTIIDISRLRESPPPELATYLLELLKELPEATISNFIFAAVQRESLPPTIFGVWLSIAKTSETFNRALNQEFSVYTRRTAIKQFLNRFGRKKWPELWTASGDTAGIYSFLSELSVSEVKLYLNEIRKHPNELAKEETITELFEGLMPLLYPESVYKTPDERPLASNYHSLLPTCTKDVIQYVLREDPSGFASRLKPHLFEKQYKLLRKLCLDIIFKGRKSSLSLNLYLRPLLSNVPALPSSMSGYSEPMLFSLTLLEKLAANPEIKIDGFIILTDLINPLLRKIRKKNLDWNNIKEIIDLAIVYLSAHEEETRYLTLGDPWKNRGHLLYFCVKLWVSSPQMEIECEPRLIFLLKLMSGRFNNIRAYVKVLTWAPNLRYKFLKLLFQHTWTKAIDIDLTESLRQVDSNIRWPCSLFTYLEVDQAVGLLKRIRDIRGDDFLEVESLHGNSILCISSSPELTNTDPSILLATLQPENPDVWERGRVTVEDRKKKAATSRVETERAFYAKSALFYAISTESLEIYGDTIIWAKRFVRDFSTSKAIFETSVCNTNEGIILLSGLPRAHLKTFTLLDITQRVSDANKIIFTIFEIVCAAMKEPSFHLPYWSGPLQLMGDVVKSRMASSGILQQTLNLSDDQLYNILWESTLELTLRLEKIGMETDYEPLKFSKPAGIIGPCGIEMEYCPRASFRFIDNLGKGRDAIWRDFRSTIYPAVATLPVALPRGLPIQFLAPQFTLNIKAAKGLIPYISSRADAIVLAKSEILEPIPEDEEIRQAIGPFVDSYRFALEIYAEQSLAPKDDHIRKAWKYVLEHLSQRMSPDEAHRTWKRIFNEALPYFKIDSIEPMTNMEYPLLPFHAAVGKYTEWNSGETFNPPAAVKSRTLEPLTYLDCTLHTCFGTFCNVSDNLAVKNLETQGFHPPESNILGLWRLSRQQLSIPAVREGLAVTALMVLEQDIGGWKGSLTRPFPSDNDVRYPDIWLDLTDWENIEVKKCFKVLERLISIIPPTLLYRVTEAAINALTNVKDDAESAKLERLAYGLLSLLGASDRPSIATDLILKVVINNPESSSWHRRLLSVRYLNRLSATQAKELLQSFSNQIQRKMRDPKSYIKVTTIKYFAQLLNGTNFVAPSFAIGILSQLFKASAHIDVRVSIVESLLDMLHRCKEMSLVDRILEALKSAIPLAGSLNEREETDWKATERTGILPTIYDQDRNEPDLVLPPILEKIIMTRIFELWEKRYMEEIVMPIIELSIENNQRWLKMFVAKHKLELVTLRLPHLPVKPKFLKAIIHRFRSNPTPQLLGLYQSFILTNMSPSPKLAAFNLKLEETEFKDDLGAKHWLSLYGKGTAVYFYDAFSLHHILRYKDTSNAIVQTVQAMLGEQARVLLRLNNLQVFDLFMEKFIYNQTGIVSGDQLKDSRLPIERIIMFIDSLRTPKWHENLNRQPTGLPRTLKYKLWLLPYPVPDATEEDLAKFARAVRESVEGISWPGNAYHEEFRLISRVLVNVEASYRAHIACILGELGWELDLVDVLCVELAKTLFETASVPKDHVIVSSRRILNQWKECIVESVRMKERELRVSPAFKDKKWEGLLLEK